MTKGQTYRPIVRNYRHPCFPGAPEESRVYFQLFKKKDKEQGKGSRGNWETVKGPSPLTLAYGTKHNTGEVLLFFIANILCDRIYTTIDRFDLAQSILLSIYYL